MTNRTHFEKVSNDDQLSAGYFNETISSLTTSAIVANLNQTNTFEDPHVVSDDLTSNSADTSTNWTYDASNDWMANKQAASSATLQFNNLLSDEQKRNLSGSESTVTLWVDYVLSGEVGTSLVGNAGFETAGGGGSDVFGSWTEATSGQTITQDGTDKTEGSYGCKISGSNTSVSGTYTGEVTQSVDVTNIDKIHVDAYYEMINDGSWVTGGGTFECGAVTANLTEGTNFTQITLDVSSLSGSQTLGCYSTFTKSGTTNGGVSCYFDNIRYELSDSSSTTTTTQMSVSYDGGTNFVNVTNGEVTNLGNTITDLAVKIVEINTTADVAVFNKVKGFGVYYG